MQSADTLFACGSAKGSSTDAHKQKTLKSSFTSRKWQQFTLVIILRVPSSEAFAPSNTEQTHHICKRGSEGIVYISTQGSEREEGPLIVTQELDYYS